MQRLAHRLERCGEFCQQQGRYAGVFIPHVRAGQIAVGFLATKDKVLRADRVDGLTDPLEPDLQRIDRGCAVAFGDASHHAGRDQRRDNTIAGLQISTRLAAGKHPVHEQRCQLVARECFPRTAPCTSRQDRQRCRGAEPVAIGIAGQHQIVAPLESLCDWPRHDGRILGVGHSARHVGEITIRIRLRPVEPEFVKACSCKHRHHGACPHAVQRRVEDRHIARPGRLLLQHGRHKERVDFAFDELHASIGHAGVEALSQDAVHAHDAVDDSLVVRRQHLHATGPVHFHGVVARWVVAGRHHDAATAVGVTHRKREFGSAAEAL